MIIHCKYDSLVRIEDLKPHPKNSNMHPKAQIERLAKILKYQGWRYAVKVSNLSGFVTSGHGRIEAARMNNWKEIPVVNQDYESEVMEYSDLTADNSIASWAELDLSSINQEIHNLSKNFDIDLLGIKSFLLEPPEDFIAKEHWSELPEFESPDEKSRIIITIEDESRREEMMQLLSIAKVKKSASDRIWSAHWPEEND